MVINLNYSYKSVRWKADSACLCIFAISRNFAKHKSLPRILNFIIPVNQDLEKLVFLYDLKVLRLL